jgi:hypothetical protein
MRLINQRRRQESKISEVEGDQPKEVPKNFFQIQNFAKDFTILRGARALLVTPASATVINNIAKAHDGNEEI